MIANHLLLIKKIKTYFSIKIFYIFAFRMLIIEKIFHDTHVPFSQFLDYPLFENVLTINIF